MLSAKHNIPQTFRPVSPRGARDALPAVPARARRGPGAARGPQRCRHRRARSGRGRGGSRAAASPRSARCCRAAGPGREVRGLRRARSSLTCPPEAPLRRRALRARGPPRPPGPRPPHGRSLRCHGRENAAPAAPGADHLSPRVPAQVREEHVPSAARRAVPSSYEIPLFRRGGKKGVRKKRKKKKKIDTSHAPSANPGGHKASVYPSAYRLGGKREKEEKKKTTKTKKHNLRESKSAPRCPEPPRCGRGAPCERGGCAEPGAAAAAPGTGRSPRGPARR